MKPLFHVVALAALLISCSKTSQETGAADSTATATDVAEPQVSSTEKTKLVTLTEEEMEQVHLAIFVRLHEFQMFSGEPGWVASTEEYDFTNNSFNYKLVRDNPLSGHFDSRDTEGGRLYQDPGDIVKEREQARLEAEEVNNPEADSTDEYGNEPEPGELDHEPSEYFVNDYDTIVAHGMFIAILESRPEDPIKTVRCRLSGDVTWANYYAANYGSPRLEQRSYYLEDIVVQLGTPQLSKDQLYLKAKILPLTDADLAGLSKDDMGYLRNEIFARHGHTFKTDKMMKYFEGKEWYRSRVDDATGLLNKVEKQNVEFIKKKEA